MKDITVPVKTTTVGRKPIEDKKLQVTMYIRSSVIEANGGMEPMKDKIRLFLGTNEK